MKIYTQTGDRGKTSLLSGERVSKSHIRVRAYGETDELNAIIGMLISVLPADSSPMLEQLTTIQSDLLHVGAWLAATPESEPQSRLIPITETYAQRLEGLIDAMEPKMPELKAFILPGGDVGAAWSHMARTVCRRAERSVIELSEAQKDNLDLQPIIAFLNRLSDYFFVLARFLNQQQGVSDRIWQP